MKNNTRPINPRLLARLKQKRKYAARLSAFNRCHAAIEPFDKKTQLMAMKAVGALLGFIVISANDRVAS